jgi:hypothetical protein
MAWSILYNNANVSSQTLAYTVPVGSEGRLSASFANRSTSATATATLWVVPNGETVGNQHLKEPGTNLGLSGTPQASLERFFVAPAGAMVYVQASNSNVSCQVQGDIVQPSATSADEVEGTSSIVYGSGWGNDSSTIKLRSIGSLVVLQGVVLCDNPTTSTLLTLPSAFRPSKALYGVAVGKMLDTSKTFAINEIGQWSAGANVLISTAGVVTLNEALNGTARYRINFNLSFWWLSIKAQMLKFLSSRPLLKI